MICCGIRYCNGNGNTWCGGVVNYCIMTSKEMVHVTLLDAYRNLPIVAHGVYLLEPPFFILYSFQTQLSLRVFVCMLNSIGLTRSW